MADNLGKYYAVNIDTGKIIWEKQINTTFNSQLKIIDNKNIINRYHNSLWCFSVKDGSKLWNFKTQTVLIKTFKKLSLIIHKDSLIFVNSIGDVFKIDLETGSLIWQIPTQNTLVRSEIDFLKISDLVLYNNSIFLSNNNNNFYSLDANSGIISWVQNVNSALRPIIIDGLILQSQMKDIS
jgi:glucose dehydrogenase